MISYMYITSISKGVFISPTRICVTNTETGEFYKDDDFIIKEQRLFAYRVGELNGHGGEIFILGVNIPQSANTYKDFVEAMETTEKVLLNSIIKIVEREPSHEVEYLIP